MPYHHRNEQAEPPVWPDTTWAARAAAIEEPGLVGWRPPPTRASDAEREASPADRRRPRRSGGRSGFPVLVVLCWAIWGLSVATSTRHGLEAVWPLWLTAIWVLAFSKRRGRSSASRTRDHRID